MECHGSPSAGGLNPSRLPCGCFGWHDVLSLDLHADSFRLIANFEILSFDFPSGEHRR
jgi:hypothetical protein